MFQTILKMLFDPRGRIGRSEMLILASLLLGIELVVTAIHAHLAASSAPIVFALKCLMFLIGVSATIKRIHDIGYSGWWILGGAAILCMWTAIIAIGGLFMIGREVLLPGSTGHFIILGLVMLPPIGMTLWLHFAEGDTYKNVYGIPPAGLMGKRKQISASNSVQSHQQNQNGSHITA